MSELFDLASRCAEKRISSSEFLNLYKEFVNEKFGSEASVNDELNSSMQKPDTCKIEAPNHENPKLAESVTILSTSLREILSNGTSLLLAEYIVEVLFANYNSTLVAPFFAELNSIRNHAMMVHFFLKSSAFFSKLNDKLIINQLCKDLSDYMIISIFSLDLNSISDELVVVISKFLQNVLQFASSQSPITISSDDCRDNSFALLARLARLNKLLHKRISQVVDSKIIFKDSKGIADKESVQEFTNSPSISSPQFIQSPLPSMKTPGLSGSAIKYKDMKLMRYYKNVWLNNKLLHWEPINSDFLKKYASIGQSLFQDAIPSTLNMDTLLIDLIETSFTCFAQFVTNRQYHQANANLNLLERKWIIFISKHIPLLVKEHSSGNASIITTALNSMDDKVVKAICAYYSEKDELKGRNEDLFDDYPSNSLDIRHDFIKSLIMLTLQPPTLINMYLSEDQAYDIKSLVTNDDLIYQNTQGLKEIVSDIMRFMTNHIDSLEISLLGIEASGISNGCQQIWNNFENISPTKQRELSIAVLNMLRSAIDDLNYTRVSKLCALLYFNTSHSLTTILTYIKPDDLIVQLLTFIDILSNDKQLRESNNDDITNKPMCFSWVISLLILLQNSFDFSLVDVAIKNPDIQIGRCYAIKFISKLIEIDDNFTVDELTSHEPANQTEAFKLVQQWLYDLFVNGSLSDSLTQNISTTQLATLIPFIMRQVILAIEIGAVDNIDSIIGGLEYILQPFMLVGLIKIVFWLESYLLSLKCAPPNDELIQTILTLLNSLIDPTSINEDSKILHLAILKLNAVSLLKVLRHFKSSSQSDYGIYSTESYANPVLDSLINKLIDVINFSPDYNIDPRLGSSENSYSQKELNLDRFKIVSENPINKILTNQINSFWSLHSSTYYNLDYLAQIIDLVTPKIFLNDVLRTLDYKLSTFGIPGTRNKIAAVELDSVLNYFFYFLVLYDIHCPEEAAEMVKYMHDEASIQVVDDDGPLKLENSQKVDLQPDDDFDMLFGETDTSIHGPDEDMQSLKLETKAGIDIAYLKRNSFGVILHSLKKQFDEAYNEGNISKQSHEKVSTYHQKYIQMLRTCVF